MRHGVRGKNPRAVADAACVTVNVLPAMVRVPTRAEEVVFAEIEYPTDPEPFPELPEVTASQLALDAAVHEQPCVAVTLTPAEAAPAATLAAVGLIENEHVTAAPA